MSGPVAAYVIGESLVDVVTTQERTSTAFGGSPRNVAFGLARLGVATELSTRIGLDPVGGHLLRDLDRAGVRVAGSSLHGGRTSTAIAHLEDNGNATYEFDIDWDWHPDPVPATTALAHTGSIAATISPGADRVLATFAELRTRGAAAPLLSFDPNIRHSLIDDEATTRRRVSAFAELVDVIKMSHEDAAWLHPGVPVADVLDIYLGAGIGMAVITMGHEGCVLSTGTNPIHMPALPVRVVDTIGAGDAFMSGMLYAILENRLDAAFRGRTLTTGQAVALAHTASLSARATVARPGAMPPTLGELTAAQTAHREVQSNTPTSP